MDALRSLHFETIFKADLSQLKELNSGFDKTGEEIKELVKEIYGAGNVTEQATSKMKSGISDVGAEAERATEETSELANMGDVLGDSFGNLGSVISGAFTVGAIVGFINKMDELSQKTEELGYNISFVKTITDADEDFLQERADGLSTKYGYDPNAIADMMYNYRSATPGVSDDVVFGEDLDTMIETARAGKVGAGDFGSIAKVFGAYRLNFPDLASEEIGNAVTALQEMGVISISEFAQKYSDVIPAAASAGMKPDEFVKLVGYATSHAGINPAESATAVKSFIKEMADPTSKLNETFLDEDLQKAYKQKAGKELTSPSEMMKQGIATPEKLFNQAQHLMNLLEKTPYEMAGEEGARKLLIGYDQEKYLPYIEEFEAKMQGSLQRQFEIVDRTDYVHREKIEQTKESGLRDIGDKMETQVISAQWTDFLNGWKTDLTSQTRGRYAIQNELNPARFEDAGWFANMMHGTRATRNEANRAVKKIDDDSLVAAFENASQYDSKRADIIMDVVRKEIEVRGIEIAVNSQGLQDGQVANTTQNETNTSNTTNNMDQRQNSVTNNYFNATVNANMDSGKQLGNTVVDHMKKQFTQYAPSAAYPYRR